VSEVVSRHSADPVYKVNLTMSDSDSGLATTTAVSPLRKKASALLLLILACVLAIEGRASLGQLLSDWALQKISDKGTFPDATRDQVRNLIKFAPSISIVKQTDYETETRFEWFSLLRPLFSKPNAALLVVSNRSEPAIALRYSGADSNADEPDAFGRIGDARNSSLATEDGGGMSASAPMIRLPNSDPLMATLDKNNDGEISERELNNADVALRKSDQNGDGILSGAEIHPPESQRVEPERQRPPMDAETDPVTETPSVNENPNDTSETENLVSDNIPDTSTPKQQSVPAAADADKSLAATAAEPAAIGDAP